MNLVIGRKVQEIQRNLHFDFVLNENTSQARDKMYGQLALSIPTAKSGFTRISSKNFEIKDAPQLVRLPQ